MKVFNSAPKKGVFAWICSSQAHVLEGQTKKRKEKKRKGKCSK
jgi:hypothetical protein